MIPLKLLQVLSTLPLEYKGDIEYVKNKLNMLILQYPKTFTNFCNYFLDHKLKYFVDGSMIIVNFLKIFVQNQYQKDIINQLNQNQEKKDFVIG